MENNDDYSDTSDEDYVPNGGEIVSEEEDSGEEENFEKIDKDESEDEEKPASNPKCRSKLPAKRRRGGRLSKANDNALNGDLESAANEEASKNDLAEEKKELEEKEKVDALWSDFMKDVHGASKAKSTVPSPFASPVVSSSSSSRSSRSNTYNKITIEQEYDFAGETVVVTKEVDANSKDAKDAMSSNAGKTNLSSTTKTSSASSTASVAPTLKRPSGGLSAVLNKLDKKPKLSTLDKSKLDWDGFKQKEGIGEELKTHNRGKAGYLERVAFLERTDQRQFEIERSLRLRSSRKQ